MTGALETIAEHNPIRNKTQKFNNPMTFSAIFSQPSKLTSKALLTKTVNAQSKDKESKR